MYKKYNCAGNYSVAHVKSVKIKILPTKSAGIHTLLSYNKYMYCAYDIFVPRSNRKIRLCVGNQL